MNASAARRILVVEDEMMVLMMIEEMLLDLGHEVAGTAQSLASALVAAETEGLDLAILDINLAGERSFPVARRLSERGVPFLFATGYGAMGLEAPFQGALTLKKPFLLNDLAKAVDLVSAG